MIKVCAFWPCAETRSGTGVTGHHSMLTCGADVAAGTGFEVPQRSSSARRKRVSEKHGIDLAKYDGQTQPADRCISRQCFAEGRSAGNLFRRVDSVCEAPCGEGGQRPQTALRGSEKGYGDAAVRHVLAEER